MSIAITTLLFILFILFEGWREAIYWHVKGGGIYDTWKSKPEEHTIFTIQRGVFFSALITALAFSINWVAVIPVIFGYMLMFSFLHNGFYYMFREKLNPGTYPKGFWAQSTTSVAVLTKFMTPVARTIMFCVGVSLVVFGTVLAIL